MDDGVGRGADERAPGGARVWVGTSGFSFPDWSPAFYPKGLPRSEWLLYYAQYFPALELNSSYYAIPKLETMRGLCERTPPGFRFIVKANKKTTHEHAHEEVAQHFREILQPLVEQGKLSGVLAQFPWSFRNTPANRDYLLELTHRTPDVQWFVEFRHRGWIVPVVGDLMRQHGVGFVSVDEPQLEGMVPPVAKATTPTAYVRFHGRNAQAWWSKSPDAGRERYNYLYSPDELQEWARKIAKLGDTAKDIFVFFNNCHAGQAITNAQMMRELLDAVPSLTLR